MWIFVQQRFRRHDLTVLAESALRDLLIDPGLLNGMELAVFGNSFKRYDFTLNAGNRRDARPRRHAIDDHRARPALAQSAAETRTSHANIIPQGVQQRGRRIDIQRVRSTIHLQGDITHLGSPYACGCSEDNYVATK